MPSRSESADAPNRHDILDLDGGGYLSIARPKDAPPLSAEEQKAFRDIAAIALRRLTPPPLAQ